MYIKNAYFFTPKIFLIDFSHFFLSAEVRKYDGKCVWVAAIISYSIYKWSLYMYVDELYTIYPGYSVCLNQQQNWAVILFILLIFAICTYVFLYK